MNTNKENIELLNLVYDMISSIYGRVDVHIKNNIKSSDISNEVATDSDAIIDYILEKKPTINKIDAIMLYHLMFLKYMIYTMLDTKMMKLSSNYAEFIEMMIEGLNTGASIVFNKIDEE